MSEPLQVITMNGGSLRATRYKQKHCEGKSTSMIALRDGDRKFEMSYDDFRAISEHIDKLSLNPMMSSRNDLYF